MSLSGALIKERCVGKPSPKTWIAACVLLIPNKTHKKKKRKKKRYNKRINYQDGQTFCWFSWKQINRITTDKKDSREKRKHKYIGTLIIFFFFFLFFIRFPMFANSHVCGKYSLAQKRFPMFRDSN